MSNTQLGPSKEEIRVLAAAVGQREAARQMGISENTVKSICYRAEDGKRVAVAVAAKQQNSLHPNAPSVADTVANCMANRHKATKLGLAGYAARMAKRAHSSGILEEAPLYKAVADIASKVWPEQSQDTGTHLSFFSISMEQPLEVPEKPVAGHEISVE